MRRSTAEIILAMLLTVLWAATLIPLFDFAVADTRLLEGFSVDELIQLNLLRKAVASHSFAMTFGSYGHLVLNLTLVVARLIPGPVTDARLLYTARAINLAFASGTALFTLAWARHAYGRLAGWVAFSLVLVNATFYMGVAEVQPDIAQMFFLVVALALTVRRYEDPNPRWTMLAAAAAGLAFACKYSGLFVLPLLAAVAALRPVKLDRMPVIRVLRASVSIGGIALIAVSLVCSADWIAAHLTEDGRVDLALGGLDALRLVAGVAGAVMVILSLLPSTWRRLQQWPKAVAVAWSWYLAAVSFAAAFVITSPYSLRKLAFVKGVIGESAYAIPASIVSSLATFRDIGSVVGWPAAVVAAATIGVLVWRGREPFVKFGAVDAVLIGWVVLFLIVLLLPFHEFYLHYALPLVPAVAMLAGRGVAGIFSDAGDASPWRQWLAGVVLVAVVAAGEAPLAAALGRSREEQRNRTTQSDQAYVAAWLQCHAPAQARVAYDYFVWVPSTFRNAFVTWGGTTDWLRSVDPDFVVVEKNTAAYASAAGTEAAEHRAYYACLPGGQCGYEPALSRGDAVVYVRTGQAAALSGRGCS
jgi:4-amino-4-deoxy-L-arabinose transferase-like glycosyltransferase